jgi:ABC-type branched-subunit amino acid transport system ATPase component
VFGNLSVAENVLVGGFVRRRATCPLEALRRVGFLRPIALLAELFVALWQPRAAQREAASAAAAVRAQLMRFGERLAPRGERRAYTLSYANRRRVEIARALNSEPALLLLDEPAAGMNPVETAQLIEQLAELRDAGQTMLIVEHKLELVYALADRVIVLDSGKKIFEGPPAGVAGDPAVREAYLGPGRAARGAQATPPVDRAALVALEDIDAFYGPAQVLTQVSISIGAGEIVSLLGGNASGKSTTMKVLLGLVSPKRGRVLIGGNDLTQSTVATRIRAGIASVPEARRVFSSLSIEENLAVGAYVRRDRDTREDLDRVYTLFPRLAERRTQTAGTLSGGEQQMLALGRALMSRPRVICMDEPTMGLAPAFVDRVLSSIVDINRLGTSILLVEQNANAALQIANRAYVLRSGSIVLCGDAESLIGDPAVEDAYLAGAHGE